MQLGLAAPFIVVHAVALSFNAATPHRLLLSSNFVHPNAFWRHMGSELGLGLSPVDVNTRPSVKLLYIPTASLYLKRDSTSIRSTGERRRRARARLKKKMHELGASLASVSGQPSVEATFMDVSDPAVDTEAVAHALHGCNCVYVEGGNTYFLMHHLRRTGFPGAFRGVTDRSLLYMGISAGAICAGRSLQPVLWKGWDETIPELETTDERAMAGMCLVEGVSFFPHHSPRFNAIATRGRASLSHKCVLLAEQGDSNQDAESDPNPIAATLEGAVEYWSSVVS